MESSLSLYLHLTSTAALKEEKKEKHGGCKVISSRSSLGPALKEKETDVGPNLSEKALEELRDENY